MNLIMSTQSTCQLVTSTLLLTAVMPVSPIFLFLTLLFCNTYLMLCIAQWAPKAFVNSGARYQSQIKSVALPGEQSKDVLAYDTGLCCPYDD